MIMHQRTLWQTIRHLLFVAAISQLGISKFVTTSETSDFGLIGLQHPRTLLTCSQRQLVVYETSKTCGGIAEWKISNDVLPFCLLCHFNWNVPNRWDKENLPSGHRWQQPISKLTVVCVTVSPEGRLTGVKPFFSSRGSEAGQWAGRWLQLAEVTIEPRLIASEG